MLANFIVRRIDAEHFELLLPRLLLESVRKRLSMFVLRSKVTIDDASGQTVRIGIGGPAALQCIASAVGPVPALFRSAAIDGGTIAALRAPFSLCGSGGSSCVLGSTHGARTADFHAGAGLPFRRRAVILPPTQDQFIPQMINLDALGGISFEKGCYTGQEIVARTRYLGRLKERLALGHGDMVPAPGARLYAPPFGDQPCGTVINASAAPGGGGEFLFVARDRHRGGMCGWTRSTSPYRCATAYALPEVAAPRRRTRKPARRSTATISIGSLRPCAAARGVIEAGSGPGSPSACRTANAGEDERCCGWSHENGARSGRFEARSRIITAVFAAFLRPGQQGRAFRASP